MNRYFEETLEFIESADMRGYLKTCEDWFEPTGWGVRRMANIVAASYMPLEKKAAALSDIYDAIKDCYPGDEDGIYRKNEIGEMCEHVSAALAAIREDCGGAVFALTLRYNRFGWEKGASPLDSKEGLHIAESVNETELFTSFDAAIDELKEMVDYYRVDNPVGPGIPDWCWFTLEKWVSADDGKMRLVIDYTLNQRGDVIYFNFMDETEHRHLRGDRYNFPESFDINLPIPFIPGDIVTIDISPYVEPFRAVIVTVGDNQDCCCVQAAWVSEDGELDVAALKHNLWFMLVLSPLYRLARFDGELPEREKPLYTLSEELRAAPETSEAVYERVSDLCERRRLRKRGIER